MKNKFLIKTNGLYFALGISSAVIIFFIFGIAAVKNNSLIDSPQNYKIISPKFSDNLSFAGEGVPLQNFEVRERIDREFLVNTYWHSATLLALKRANRWFPVIEPILKSYNVPG